MAGRRSQQAIISFKADASLLEALRGIVNRSEFIRAALLTALENLCPLCRGSGLLTPHQKRHWETFRRDHAVYECEDCHAMHLVCGGRTRRRGRATAGHRDGAGS